jgi:hypothetical protein
MSSAATMWSCELSALCLCLPQPAYAPWFVKEKQPFYDRFTVKDVKIEKFCSDTEWLTISKNVHKYHVKAQAMKEKFTRFIPGRLHYLEKSHGDFDVAAPSQIGIQRFFSLDFYTKSSKQGSIV